MDRLRKYLEQERISQADFARLAGLSQPALSQYVSGVRRPNVDAALAIERASNGAIPMSDWAHSRRHTKRVRRAADGR